MLHERMSANNIQASCYNIDSDQVFILNFDISNNAKIEEKIQNIVSETIQYFFEKYELKLLGGYSKIIRNTDDFSIAYSQAKHALEYTQIFHNYSLRSYEQVIDTEMVDQKGFEDNNAIINFVMTGQKDEVKESINLIIDRMKEKPPSIFDAKYLLFFFYRTTLRLKELLIQKYGSDYPKTVDTIYAIFTTPQLDQNINLVLDMYLEVCDFINSRQKTPSISQQIQNYIDNNYIDADLNVNTLADYFNYAPSYLSMKYKRETGESIIDYLYKTRIKHGKELLETTNLKIYNIATLVGFHDSNAFIRIFKKLEGITPGSYKKLNLSQQ